MTKENLPLILALVVFAGFISILWLLAFHSVPDKSHDILVEMTGVLGAGFNTLIGYYFGSSASSAKKTEIIEAQQKGNGK